MIFYKKETEKNELVAKPGVAIVIEGRLFHMCHVRQNGCGVPCFEPIEKRLV